MIAETVNAEMWLDDPSDVELYARVWNEFNSAAVFNRQARRIIARAQAALEAP